MATAVVDKVREALKASGHWGDFVRIRDDLRAEGMKSAEASRKTLERMAAEGKIPEEMIAQIRERGRPKKSDGFERTLADVKREKRDERLADSAKTAKIGEVLVTKDMFAGKKCSLSRSFMWAYSNLCFADVSPDDAPSAVAWQMFIDMKTSPSLKADMLKSGLGSAMRKAEDEDVSGERFDGATEYDLMASMQASGGADA